jgi:hypothetical protein
MKKRTLTLLITLLVLAGLAVHSSCKKNEDVEHVLSVSVADGVDGTPVAGTYLHNIGDQVPYEYTLRDKFENLNVKFDGEDVEPSGTITISTSHLLTVTADPEPGDFLLSVALADGVTGTPERGNYYYDTGQTLDYSYSLEDGYTNMRVTLNGDEVPASGTLVFDRAHTLFVFADKYFEIRGAWTISERYEDGSFFTVTLTFDGETGASGTVVDSDGGSGAFETAGPQLTFTIEYPEVTYEYVGIFSDETNMSGNCRRTTASGEFLGTWNAAKDSTSTTSRRTSYQGKGKN